MKTSFQDFFTRYKNWELEHSNVLIRKKGLSISDSKNHYITIPPKLLLSLDGTIKQLNIQTLDKYINEIDFYKGDEPTFNLIIRGVDVIKSVYIFKFKNEIRTALNENNSTFIPIFFITGDFGIGKSTFTLRLIFELEKDDDLDLVAFEIIDPTRLRKEALIDLINHCKSKNIIFYFDDVEIDSFFKSLLDIQRDLSIEQFQDCNVFFIVPIRENILEKYKLDRDIPRAYQLNMKGNLEREEVEDLLEKLKKSGLIEFRDISERNELIKKIQDEFNSDSFISLMELVTSGRHENDLINSYHQLSKDAQNAFLYTALLHKHKLLMPASWLKQNISMTWDEFITKIIKAEGKGILIQEIISTRGTTPDLYFRTKHPLIASKLVERLLPNKNKQFNLYEKMLRTIDYGHTNSYLANNLLKSFVRNSEWGEASLNKLYDAAFTKLSDDPYFLLNYAINLQNRNTKTNLLKAIELLLYAESLLEYRNHRFIHRRAVLNFETAKLFYSQENELNNTYYYLKEAKELFTIKQLLDPFSSYSYVDFIKMLIWELENIQFEKDDELQKQILIEELFDLATRTVTDGIERINNLKTKYANYIKNVSNNEEYKNYLDDLYSDTKLRPYACILLHSYYQHMQDHLKCKEIISEMEYYQENFEIVKFLFKYYGRNLFDPNNRIKLFKLSKENPNLERENPLRFNLFNFIAETYNYHYYEGRKYLNNIRTRYNNINPEFHYIWLDSDGKELLFDAQIIKSSNEKYKVKISSIQLTTRLIRGNYESYLRGSNVKVKIHFYLYGLMAEIVKNDVKN